MGILLLIFFVFIVIGYTTKTSKPADHRIRKYRDSQEGSFDTTTTTTNFFNAQHISNQNSFDNYSENCSSDSCGDQGCSDSNCDCGGSEGGSCD
jgi:hypothetical protein